ncbi:hypothetical protein Dimus_039093 [Dionaea muscipula]
MSAPAPTQLTSSPPYPLTSTIPNSPRSSITISTTAGAVKSKNPSLQQTHRQVDPTVSWTSSIARYCRYGRLSSATKEFIRMRLAGVEPNHNTFLTLLSGCAHFPSKGPSLGAAIHALVRKLSLDTENVMVGTALVDMYAKSKLVELARVCFDEMVVKNSLSWNTMIDGYMRNGRFEDAVALFDEMPERDLFSWTALISGFVKQGLYERALEWFHEMQLYGIEPDHVTIIAVITACGNLGSLNLGLWVTQYVMARELWDNVKVCNSLINMYSRCGCMNFALQVFHNMPSHTSVSWNAIINGFAVNGNADEALKYFSAMQEEGFQPDEFSFKGALSACSHAGLVDKGLLFFDNMQKIYGISPRIEHYGCIVGLYIRAGRLEDALNVVKNMKMKPNEAIIGSLLAACRNCGDVGLAEMLMKNEAGRARRKMNTRRIIQKKPGASSVEINNEIHEFVANDQSHADNELIYAMLEILSFELRSYGLLQGEKMSSGGGWWPSQDEDKESQEGSGNNGSSNTTAKDFVVAGAVTAGLGFLAWGISKLVSVSSPDKLEEIVVASMSVRSSSGYNQIHGSHDDDQYPPATVYGTSERVRWERPPSGFYKLNFDGSARHQLYLAGAGCIIRDDTGSPVVAASYRLNRFNVSMAEAEALLKGLELAKRLNNIRYLYIEGDSKEVIDRARGVIDRARGLNSSEITILISEVRSKMRLYFEEYEIEHVSNEANKVADALAYLGAKRANEPEELIWYKEELASLPRHVKELIDSEKASSYS